MLVHASIDERGKASGGVAGDQTGKEVCIRSWYSKPWNALLRYPNKRKVARAVKIAIKLANSGLVGYDQGNRNSLYKELKKKGFNAAKYIKTGVKTETDCSAFMYACFACVIPEMRMDTNAPTTSTMRKFFEKFGFEVITDKTYLVSDALLKSGDILVKEGSHAAMHIDT